MSVIAETDELKEASTRSLVAVVTIMMTCALGFTMLTGPAAMHA